MMLNEHRLFNRHIGLWRTGLTSVLMLLLLMAFSGKVLAASLITLNAPDSAVEAGQQINFSGKVTVGNIPVGITITDPKGSFRYIDQVTAAADGSFSFRFATSSTDLAGNWMADVAGGGTTGHTSFVVNSANNNSGGGSGSSHSGGGVVVTVPTPANSTTGEAKVLLSTAVFSDVPASHWADNFIKELHEAGYINGYPDSQFKPDNSVSRAELVTIMDKVLKLPAYNPASSDFSDVTKTDWCYASVENLYHAGITKGYSNNLFGPGNPITREELACILVKALGRQTEAEASMMEKTGFADNVGISSWARGFVVVAVKYGLIKGYPDDKSFRPHNSATRAEVCAMISNFRSIKR